MFDLADRNREQWSKHAEEANLLVIRARAARDRIHSDCCTQRRCAVECESLSKSLDDVAHIVPSVFLEVGAL